MACETSFHTACFDELGGCATLGCAERGKQPTRAFRRVERPEPRNTHVAVPAVSSWCGVWFVLELIGLIGSIAACFLG